MLKNLLNGLKKKIINAPEKIPSSPLGANGTQFSGFTYRAPKIIKDIIIKHIKYQEKIQLN